MTDSRWEETAIYIAFGIGSAYFITIFAVLRLEYGPDWQEGMRQHNAYVGDIERWKEERRRKGILSDKELSALLLTDPDAWWRERQKFIEWRDEYPQSVWWRPRDMHWDGSCPRLGLESDSVIAARKRWPAWFAHHEGLINAHARANAKGLFDGWDGLSTVLVLLFAISIGCIVMGW